MTERSARLLAFVVGVVSALVVLAAAELAALFLGAEASPLFAVGSLVIDLAPPGVKELVISLFGTGDKAALLTLMGVLIVVISGLAGLLESKRPPWGVVIFGVGGVVALIAVLTRAGASGIDGAPTVIGSVIGIVVLQVSLRRLRRWRTAANQPGSNRNRAPGQVERRSFLGLAVTAGVSALVLGTGARIISASSTAITEVRRKLILPKPATTAPPVPAGASLDIPGISSIVTSNADFYRIDTALQVPRVDPDTWMLKITGLVENEIEISFKELLAMPLEEHMLTLTCVSNDVGDNLIGNALWLGYPIRELLKQAVPKAGADMVLSTSVDGFTAGTPLEILQDENVEALLAVGMNGTPLPQEHGFPVRMVVPGLYGYVSATKWVVSLEVTKFSEAQGYWVPRGWSALGPVKLASRIDTPQTNSAVSAGMVAVAGVAWQQHVGVQGVEVQVDNGKWMPARLADSISADTWRQWVYEWPATKGLHSLRVRATNADGTLQKSRYEPPAPNGSEGLHEISVNVT
jgi:DMSO/TMAO reductase YedYZ molybdopterin-dependent catalytic subunit